MAGLTMTRDDIIRMAEEAEIDAESDTLCRYEGWVEPLQRFAALVAAAEREACAKVCESEGQRIDAGWSSCAATIRARGQQ